MKGLIFVLLATLAYQTSARELLPSLWFEQIAATDGSTQHSLVFQSTSGVLYTIESSNDLNTWEAIHTIHGLGHEYIIPLKESSPPPNPPNPPASFVPYEFVGLLMRPSASSSGGIVLSWNSIDSHNPVTYWIDQTPHPDWMNVPSFAEYYDGFFFSVSHPPTPVDPPSENPDLGIQDAAMISVFETSFPSMNQAVANATASARGTPPPAPPGPDSRLFLRIVADWTLDSDGDGSPDWAEFAVMSDSSHPQTSLADPFSANNAGSGSPVGSILDTDSDSIPDDSDVVIDDALIDWAKQPAYRYAVFPINRGAPDLPPLHINSLGTVLFQDGVWLEGNFHNLDMQGTTAEAIQAIGMNDLGQIIGIGYRTDAPPSPPPGGTEGSEAVANEEILVWWDSRHTDGPVPVSDGTNDALDVWAPYFANPSPLVPLSEQFPYDSCLDNDGHFVAQRHGENLGDPQIRKVWRRTETGFAEVEDTGAQCLFTYSPGFSFGPSGTDTAIWTGGALSSTQTGNINRLASLPGGRLAGVRLGAPPLIFAGNPTWETSDFFPQIPADLNHIGTFPLAPVSELIYHGEDAPFVKWDAVAPNVPAGQSQQARHVDNGGNGWLLSEQETGHTASMPIIAWDSQPGYGVDPVSISSTTPGDACQNRAWIMAGIGRNAVFQILSGANSEAEVTMTAAGLKFLSFADFHDPNGPPPADSILIDSQNVSIVIPGEDIDTALNGSEILPVLTLGGTSSVSSPLGIKVMKPRTVRVKLWVIPKQVGVSSYHDTILGEDPAALEGFRSDFEAFLNSICEPQINATFDVELERTAPVDFESEDAEDYGGPPGITFDGGNGILNNFNTHQGELGGMLVHNDPLKSINIYLVGGVIHGQDVEWDADNQRFHLNPEAWWGITDRENRRCWIAGGSTAATSGNPTVGRLKSVIAHEIGHVLVGYGHPDAGGGAAPLPRTRHRDRLMCSGKLQAEDGSSRLLVKAEWDEAEEWMIREEDDGRIAP